MAKIKVFFNAKEALESIDKEGSSLYMALDGTSPTKLKKKEIEALRKSIK
jgi:hypothetical protein